MELVPLNTYIETFKEYTKRIQKILRKAKFMSVDLSKYLTTQKNIYTQTYSDIFNKKYDSGWIDYIFPRLEEQCDSPRSKGTGLKSKKEVEKFWNTQLLHNNYIEMLKLLNNYTVEEYKSIISERGRYKIKQSLNIFIHQSNYDDFYLISKFLEEKYA